jgi:hypothetical protein
MGYRARYLESQQFGTPFGIGIASAGHLHKPEAVCHNRGHPVASGVGHLHRPASSYSTPVEGILTVLWSV